MRFLRWAPALLLIAAGWGPCDFFYISVSDLSPQRFSELAAESGSRFPGKGYAWFEPSLEPKLVLTKTNLKEVAEIVLCCSLTPAEMEEILVKHLKGAAEGRVSAAAVYEDAFGRGLHKAKVFEPLCFDCMSTALTYYNAYHFKAVDERDVENPTASFFGLYYKPVAEEAPLQWGNMIKIDRDGTPAHVMIYLANGLVLHKLGQGEARIEPLLNGVAYYEAYFRAKYPSSPNVVTLSRWRQRRAGEPIR